ncbi:MAG TPA: hypothetical protein VFX58_14820 [Chitinophagaceae bacterium]|nr:hypothetical protein [Chitinophagaceae bacterium]
MLLLFLVLFLNVKLVVKLVVLLLFLVLNVKMETWRSFLRQRFSWFYLIMIGLALVNFILNFSSLTSTYSLVIITGVVFWLMSLGAAYIIYGFVQSTGTEKLHQTVQLFFLLNVIISFAQLLVIMVDAGSLNPYTFQGMNQKYFIGTGDHIRGLSFDVSTTNAVISGAGLIYFLFREKWLLVLTCMAAILLSASNFTNLVVVITLLFIFLFQSNRIQKTLIILCACMLITFMAKVSPQNKHYIKYIYQKLSHQKIDTIPPDIGRPSLSSYPDSVLTAEERKKKFAMLYLDSLHQSKQYANRVSTSVSTQELAADAVMFNKKPLIPVANIHSAAYQRKKDTTILQKQLIDFALATIPAFDTSLTHTQQQKLPGKLLAFQQSFQWLKKHPSRLLTGAGTGQFASKLAFRATGTGIAGGYPNQLVYISDAFRDNHLNLYLNYFSKDKEIHSLVNSPDSVYDQLLAEYGLLGLFAFVFLYLGYFARGMQKKSYRLPLLIVLSLTFMVGYWFEQLSIVILFELLLLLNLRENSGRTQT